MKINNNVFRMPALGLLLPLIAGMILSGWNDAAWSIRALCVLVAGFSVVVCIKFMPVAKCLVQIVLLMAAGFGFMKYDVALTDFPFVSSQQPPENQQSTESRLQSEKRQPLTSTLLLIANPVEKCGWLRCDVLTVNVSGYRNANQKNDNSTVDQKAGNSAANQEVGISIDNKQVGISAISSNSWIGRTLRVYIPKIGDEMHLPDDGDAATLRMGDCIYARFVPQRPENYSDDFDYASYLRNKGFTATAYISADKWRMAPRVNIPLGWRLRIKAERCRTLLMHTYEKYGIENNRLALVSALSLGKKDLMDREIRDRFAAAGVSHVLAVSGMHVGIVYAFVNTVISLLWSCLYLLKRNCLPWLKKTFEKCTKLPPKQQPKGQPAGECHRCPEPYVKKRTGLIIRQLLVVAVLWAYAFITGLPASVIRAVTMFTLSAGAVCLCRRSQTWNNLFFTAFLMLCMHPSYLFDIGFQMSFAAVLAILLFLPALEQMLGLKRNDETFSLFGEVVFSQFNCENTKMRVLLSGVWRYMVSSLLVSVAAQLGTAPLSIYYFHRYPQWFLLANFVLVPTAVALTWAALAFQCVAAIPFVPEVIKYAVAGLLSGGLNFFTKFAFFVESLPGAVVDGMMPPLEGIAVVYLLLICVFRFFKKKTYLYTLENLIRRIRSARYGKYMKNR